MFLPQIYHTCLDWILNTVWQLDVLTTTLSMPLTFWVAFSRKMKVLHVFVINRYFSTLITVQGLLVSGNNVLNILIEYHNGEMF